MRTNLMPPPNQDPSRTQLRVFAAAWLAAGGFWACFALKHGHGTGAAVATAAGLLVPAAGLVSLRAVRWVWTAMTWLTFPIGRATSEAMLAVLYFGVFTPAGLVLRLCRHDPLDRSIEGSAESYWRRRGARKSPASYLTQR